MAAHASQLPPVYAAQVLAIEQDGASGGPVQLQYAPPRRGLPAPALPYQPERLSSSHDEADVIDCLDVPHGALDEDARGHRKVHLQVLHLDEHLVCRSGGAVGDAQQLHFVEGGGVRGAGQGRRRPKAELIRALESERSDSRPVSEHRLRREIGRCGLVLSGGITEDKRNRCCG